MISKKIIKWVSEWKKDRHRSFLVELKFNQRRQQLKKCLAWVNLIHKFKFITKMENYKKAKPSLEAE